MSVRASVSVQSDPMLTSAGFYARQPAPHAPVAVRHTPTRRIPAPTPRRSANHSLPRSVGKEIRVRLKWGYTEYTGALISADSYMNLQLANTEEFIDGKSTGSLGQVLIRYVPAFATHRATTMD